MISLSPKGGTRASECIECSEKFLFLYETFQIDSNNQICQIKKRVRIINGYSQYSHIRKYSPFHFMTRAGAALVRTITSFKYTSHKQVIKSGGSSSEHYF